MEPNTPESIDFVVVNSLRAFVESEAFISIAQGPVGSLKTTSAIIKIFQLVERVHPCRDGVRRSRGVWVRNTREQLDDTSLRDFLLWVPDGVLGHFEKTKRIFHLKYNDVECEILFRALDKPGDARKLLSLQLTFAVLEELREIDPDVYDAIQARVGRYPNKVVNDEGCVRDDKRDVSGNFLPAQQIWCMTNPPDFGSFYEQIITDPPKNTHITVQPSALSPEADWLEYLPPNYYTNLMQGKSKDYIDVYIHSKFGRILSGQPVFGAYSRSIHVAKQAIVPFPTEGPVLIGADSGLSPAIVVVLQGDSGRLVVTDALSADNKGAFRFIREDIIPLLNRKYRDRKRVVILDPEKNRSQTDEKTVMQIYEDFGFEVVYAPTNSITTRISAVDGYLTRIVHGIPALTIDPVNAKTLDMALAGKYVYKDSDTTEKKPAKTHPWSDVADALQYVCLYTGGGNYILGVDNSVHKARPVVTRNDIVW